MAPKMSAILTIDGRLFIINATNIDDVLQKTSFDPIPKDFGDNMQKPVNLMLDEIVELPLRVKQIARTNHFSNELIILTNEAPSNG